MTRLSSKNVASALRMVKIVGECNQVVVCLWDEINKEIPEELMFGCYVYDVLDCDVNTRRYQRECPIFKMRADCQRASPAFLKTWRDFGKEDPSPHIQEAFLEVSFYGIATLYLANNNQIPFMSESFIENTIKRASKNPRVFYTRLLRELMKLHPSWIINIGKQAEQYEDFNYAWGRILLLFKIFLDGMKPLRSGITQKDIKDIERFLEKNKK